MNHPRTNPALIPREHGIWVEVPATPELTQSLPDLRVSEAEEQEGRVVHGYGRGPSGEEVTPVISLSAVGKKVNK